MSIKSKYWDFPFKLSINVQISATNTIDKNCRFKEKYF